MRTRRFTITAFLLAAIMVLGIGFAELADQLDITGTVEISKTQADATFDGDVHFNTALNYTYGAGNTNVVKTGSEHHTSNSTAGGNVTFSAEGDTATFMSTTFADIGDTTSIVFEIVNEFSEKIDVVATISYTNNTGDVFSAVIEGWNDNKATIDAKDAQGNGTSQFTLKVTLTKVPEETVNATISVKFAAKVHTGAGELV